MYASIYANVHTHTHAYIYMYVHIYIHTYVCIHKFMSYILNVQNFTKKYIVIGAIFICRKQVVVLLFCYKYRVLYSKQTDIFLVNETENKIL